MKKARKCIHRITAEEIPEGKDWKDYVLACEKDKKCPVRNRRTNKTRK